MKKRIGTFLAVLAILSGTTFTGVVLAANPSADLDQCANDPSPSPSTNGCSTAASDWVNGNLGASKSVYFEDDSIPYRMRFGNLGLASNTVIIEWDTTKAGKHALDYIDDFDESVNVPSPNPCLGVAGCSPASFTTFGIPADPQVTGAGVTPKPGVFRMYGGTITGVSTYSYANGTGFAGDKSARIAITFTPSRAWRKRQLFRLGSGLIRASRNLRLSSLPPVIICTSSGAMITAGYRPMCMENLA